MEYLLHNVDTLLTAVGEHLSISLMSLVIAATIGIFAGYLCVRFHASEKFIMPLFQTLRVVPSLAILLLLIPLLGTGVMPAIVGLVILGIPPILINTVSGLQNVPGWALETAEGCGMTSSQAWYNVRFPLALPAMLTGLKIALVEIIASATLAAKIGAGGLGEIIFTGLALARTDMLLVGGITVALLSLAAGLIFNVFDRLVIKHT